QEMGIHGGIVMDGRDIGTVVFPNAELKIFLNASIEVRAKRRTQELLARGLQADFETIKSEIAERDHRDQTREFSPLIKAKDAIEIDTSAMTVDQQAAEILRLANLVLGK
ncbi:MAG: (d)CMP kinase, partial [Candidatus Kapabacteria bacterium]|nr:(d)CMP kinase [Candidatus Kapabacteria bacterium]